MLSRIEATNVYNTKYNELIESGKDYPFHMMACEAVAAAQESATLADMNAVVEKVTRESPQLIDSAIKEQREYYAKIDDLPNYQDIGEAVASSIFTALRAALEVKSGEARSERNAPASPEKD